MQNNNIFQDKRKIFLLKIKTIKSQALFQLRHRPAHHARSDVQQAEQHGLRFVERVQIRRQSDDLFPVRRQHMSFVRDTLRGKDGQLCFVILLTDKKVDIFMQSN